MAYVFGTTGNDYVHVLGDGWPVPVQAIDTPLATNTADVIYSGGDGIDVIRAGDGDDAIHFDADLAASDTIDGGGGNDTLWIDGQVDVIFGSNSLVSIEFITFSALGLPSYIAGRQSLTVNDANFAAGQKVTVNAGNLESNVRFVFDGRAETDAKFEFYGGFGRDSIAGGQGNDTFFVGQGGNDTVVSGGGYDTFYFSQQFTASDVVVGDAVLGGKLVLDGPSYAAGVTFGSATLTNINVLWMNAGNSYWLVTHDASVAAGRTLEVDAQTGASRSVRFDGSAETDGHFVFYTGSSSDILTGGASSDTFHLLDWRHNQLLGHYTTGGGSDTAYGGAGDDVFYGGTAYNSVAGGDGFDTLYASAPSPTAVIGYTAANWSGIEKLVVGPVGGQAVTVVVADGNVAAGGTLIVQGADSSFHGAAETDAHFRFNIGGSGIWTGGALSDSFLITTAAGFGAPPMQAFGGGGNDSFTVTAGYGVTVLLLGGAGNDTYIVDDLGDRAFETTTTISTDDAGGVDTVRSSVTYSLDAYAGVRFVEKLTLTGAGDAEGTGNALDNVISGNGGNNTLSGLDGNDSLRGGLGDDVLFGGLGADSMSGGAGNDTYEVNDAGDVMVEAAGNGTDLVRFAIACTLGDNFENMTALGSADLAGTGNELANAITGNGGSNVLAGLGGSDTLVGGLGADRLNGGQGADLLVGGLGRDVLIGGAGADAFLFDTTPGGGNHDVILDYSVADDTIRLAASVFAALPLGALSAAAFGANLTGEATTSTQRILYETDTGSLYYDADGFGGSAGVRFAIIDPNLAGIGAGEFVIV